MPSATVEDYIKQIYLISDQIGIKEVAMGRVADALGVVPGTAPYLITGFSVAGLLQWLINPTFVRQQLGKQSLRSILKATIIGIPMPLCSCSVIPVAASLRKSGASKGATASFLSSTPPNWSG